MTETSNKLISQIEAVLTLLPSWVPQSHSTLQNIVLPSTYALLCSERLNQTTRPYIS